MPRLRFSSLLFLYLMALAGSAFAADADPGVLIEKGHYKQSRPLLEKRLAANPKDADALVLMARLKLAYNDPEEAKKLLQQAIAVQPKLSAAHLYLADAYSRGVDNAGMFQKMHLAKDIKSETDQALALDSRSGDALDGLVDLYLEAPGMMGGSVSKARDTAEKLMLVDPVKGNLAKAKIAQHEKEYDKVEGFHLKAIEAGPRSFDALLETAGLYSRDRWKNHDKAIDYAQRALQADPTRAGAYSLLAQLYALHERWSDLDQIIAKSEKAVPDDFSPHYNAARILVNSGKDNPRAERYFRKYLTQEPEGNAPPLAGAHWRLGLVLEKEGRKQEAIQEVRTAVQMKPDLKEAEKDLKRLKG